MSNAAQLAASISVVVMSTVITVTLILHFYELWKPILQWLSDAIKWMGYVSVCIVFILVCFVAYKTIFLDARPATAYRAKGALEFRP